VSLDALPSAKPESLRAVQFRNRVSRPAVVEYKHSMSLAYLRGVTRGDRQHHTQ
jgi:hypothetical protein